MTPISQNTRTILAMLATNSKQHAETNATKVSLDSGVPYAEVLSTLRVLEEQGYGTLIVGRKGAATRFAWTYAHNGEHAAVIAKVSPSGEFSAVKAPPSPAPVTEKSFSDKMAFTISGRTFEVTMPHGPTLLEIASLTALLQALVKP